MAEYVLQLPTFTQGSSTRVAAQSDLLALSHTQFLVLTRDSGNGHGLVPTSIYRTVTIYDITGATNIAGTAYDTAATPIARAPYVTCAAMSQRDRKYGARNGSTAT